MNSAAHSRLLHDILYSAALPTDAKRRTTIGQELCGMRGERSEDEEDEGNGVERSSDGPTEGSCIGISGTER